MLLSSHFDMGQPLHTHRRAEPGKNLSSRFDMGVDIRVGLVIRHNGVG